MGWTRDVRVAASRRFGCRQLSRAVRQPFRELQVGTELLSMSPPLQGTGTHCPRFALLSKISVGASRNVSCSLGHKRKNRSVPLPERRQQIGAGVERSRLDLAGSTSDRNFLLSSRALSSAELSC